jgi:hypothetical protein
VRYDIYIYIYIYVIRRLKVNKQCVNSQFIPKNDQINFPNTFRWPNLLVSKATQIILVPSFVRVSY